MKIVSIIGARPQFVKAAAVSRALADRQSLVEVLVHTGQHFDPEMSEVFFRELQIPQPQYNLGIHGGGHGAMTGRMLEALEPIVLMEEPDAMLVYGDTNSTLAGALVAAKLEVPVAHVEAGLRSFNRTMPEEINRVITDHLSDILFCPTSAAVSNLVREGITEGVYNVGDVMYDATLHAASAARHQSKVLERLSISERGYVLATVHRAENTKSPEALSKALQFLRSNASGYAVVLPLHPRTRIVAEQANLSLDDFLVIEPLGYFDMHRLLQSAAMVYTDSGGVQKEAYFHRVPCVTLRNETEWVETIDCGWNRLWHEPVFRPRTDINEYGDGHAADKIVANLEAWAARRAA
jgi:UDP-GlcNAc3NAcA epimerase